MKVKFLEQAFADKGQKVEIPSTRPGDGGLNWEEGFTLPYSKNPENDGKYIEREQINELFNIITQHQMRIQECSAFSFNDEFAKKIKYKLYQRATIYYNPFTATLIGDPDNILENDIQITQPLVVMSMTKDNATSPLVYSNLFTHWWVEDGALLGELKFMSINKSAGAAFPAPPGYLELGIHEGDEPTEFEFAKYPRLARLVQDNKHPFLKKVSGKDAFTIIDIRGMFPRVFSNGSRAIDKDRVFETTQTDAGRTLKGEFMAVDKARWAGNVEHAKNRSFYENCVNMSIFYAPHGTDLRTRSFFGQSDRNAFTAVRENTIGGADVAENYNLQYSTFLSSDRGSSGDAQRQLLGNKVRFNSADVWPTATEFRPHNFNVKVYMKA